MSAAGTNVYLLYLEWPERCFRAGTSDLAYFRTLVPAGSKVVRVRSDRAFLRALPTATHAVVWHFRREWFDRAPRLRVLATPAAGREFVPSDAPPGVTVHFGGFHGGVIAESVLAFLLAWSRGFFAVERQARGGADLRGESPRWPRTWLSSRCSTLAGAKAVVIGFGRIGRTIAAKLEAQGAQVTGVTRHGVFASSASRRASRPAPKTVRDLPELRTADVLVLALPGDTGTDNLLDARVLAKLPRRCVVVNIGRGNSVDERSLIAALRRGRLAAAYLDVCKAEPTALMNVAGGRPADAAVLSADAAELPWNLFVMPHASAFSADYLRRCFKELKDAGLV